MSLETGHPKSRRNGRRNSNQQIYRARSADGAAISKYIGRDISRRSSKKLDELGDGTADGTTVLTNIIMKHGLFCSVGQSTSPGSNDSDNSRHIR